MIQVLQLLLSLSILVFFHELGHFAFAKIFKTRVEKFYLFFNPWFSLFKIKKGETEYGIGWLPLGGYVKISGMIDESMDKEQMKQPPKPWEFRSKPAWQRLLIMLGGVLVNFLLAVIIYVGILFVWGEQKLPVSEINKYGIVVDSLGQEFGLKTGDKIIKVNGKKVDAIDDAFKDLVLTSPHQMTIDRNGKDTLITITEQQISYILKSGPFFAARHPFIISDLPDSSAAVAAGFKKDDKIIAIDNKKIDFYDEVKPLLDQNKNKKLNFLVLRGNDTVPITMKIPQTGKIGVYIDNSVQQFYEIDSVNYNLVQSIPAGFNKMTDEVGYYLKQFKLIFTPKTEAYKSVGSFITIGKLFSKKWDWRRFWSMTALLSIMLGVVNILPIPALDGGHVMFTLYEMIIGRKPSDKFLERAQVVGMIILLFLVVYALGNDIINNLF